MNIVEANEEVKFQYETLCERIKKAQEEIEILQNKICAHTETIEGIYSWRIGSMQSAQICKYCGKVIRFI